MLNTFIIIQSGQTGYEWNLIDLFSVLGFLQVVCDLASLFVAVRSLLVVRLFDPSLPDVDAVEGREPRPDGPLLFSQLRTPGDSRRARLRGPTGSLFQLFLVSLRYFFDSLYHSGSKN